MILSNIGFQVGPLRCWPGGLSVSRTIGDIDASTAIVPIPHVKQIKVCNSITILPSLFQEIEIMFLICCSYLMPEVE